MEILPITTRILRPPQDDFLGVLTEVLPHTLERSIVVLSSKAVAIGEGRCVPVPDGTDVRALKERLAHAEADLVLRREPGLNRHFTILHGSLMGSSGIDESNANGHLILWPEDPMESARAIRTALCTHFGVRELGVILADSHSMPLHNGALGIAIGYAGFLPLKDYRETPDLFGRLYKFERLNIADSLAVTATFAMGEGDESTPAVVMRNLPHVTFTDMLPHDPYLSLTIPLEHDYFRVFLQNAPWEQGGGGTKL